MNFSGTGCPAIKNNKKKQVKYYIFIAAFLLVTIAANCQLDKKYWLVGGSGSFFSYNDEFTTPGQPTISGKLTEINLAANIGYFFADKFAAGLRPGINSVKSRGLNTASAGTELFFNSAVGLEFLVGYLDQNKSIKDDQPGFTNARKGFYISAGFQIHLTNG